MVPVKLYDGNHCLHRLHDLKLWPILVMAVTAKPPAQVFKKYFTAGKNFRLKSKIVPFSTIFNEFLSSNIRIYCSLKSF